MPYPQIKVGLNGEIKYWWLDKKTNFECIKPRNMYTSDNTKL